jgi:hypothetical protein
MEDKFGLLETTKKVIDMDRDEISHKNCRFTLFLTTEKDEEILEELKVEPAEEELRRYKSNWL